MRFTRKEPCESCPYRKDAPLGRWHPENLDRLGASAQDQMGALYACHGTAKKPEMDVCAGWLLKQKEADIPAIHLRLELARNDEALACFKQVSDGGHELYDTVEEMIEANEALGRCERCGRYLTGTCGTCPACDIWAQCWSEERDGYCYYTKIPGVRLKLHHSVFSRQTSLNAIETALKNGE